MTEFSKGSESRLRISPSLVRATGKTATAASQRTFGEVKLGKWHYEQSVRAQVEYLRGLADMAHQAGSYRNLLSGESQFSMVPVGQHSIRDKQVLSKLGLSDRGVMTFGTALAGPDYAALKRDHPNDRYKFYSSFDLTTPAKAELGAQWFTDVATRAHAQGLSLTTKSFDHAYDSLNLYTWHPAEVAGIITELYPTYAAQGLYSETPHFMQGNLHGVSPDHVGFVQEPVTGWPADRGLSHSARMGMLGATLDEYLLTGEGLTLQAYEQAAQAVGVNPAQPYLLVGA